MYSPKTTLTRAANISSSNKIIEALNRIAQDCIPEKVWLKDKHRYKTSPAEKISHDVDNNQLHRNRNEIAEYVSVSTITHCVDGWNFLSRSIECLLSGDQNVAIQLGYFSELRAVMSLLANEGIGIFKDKHVCFDEEGNCKFFNGANNHETIHGIINEWSNVPTKTNKVFDSMQYNGITFNDWIEATGQRFRESIYHYVLSDWLSEWSIDLKLKEDSLNRNIVSYRPNLYEEQLNFNDNVNKISELWSASEPKDSDNFPNLDSFLLRVLFKNIYDNTYTVKKRNEFLKDTFSNMGISLSSNLEAFFLKSDPFDYENRVLEEAKKNVFNGDVIDCFPIIARGYLLLRIATGFTENLLNECNISSSDLKFWINPKGFNYGLWDNYDDVFDFKDLYIDIQDSLNNIFDSDYDKVFNQSQREVINNYSLEMDFLKQFQRVSFWGLGL